MSESTMQSTNYSDMTMHDEQNHDDKDNTNWMVALVFLMLLGMISLFVADQLYHPEKFRIEQIEVRGQLKHVNGSQVTKVVQQSLDGNYFSASLDQLEAEINQIPWVFNTTVRRQWPSTLVVRIDEVQPIAEWGDDQWLNSSGDLVKRQPWNHPLPVLRGPIAMQKEVWRSFQRWHEKFVSHGLSLDRLEFDERELWYLTLSLSALAIERVANIAGVDSQPLTKAEVTMIVDNGDAEGRISRLIEALNSQLIAEFPGMKSIDLRYPNGFAIDWIKQSPDSQKLTNSK